MIRLARRPAPSRAMLWGSPPIAVALTFALVSEHVARRDAAVAPRQIEAVEGTRVDARYMLGVLRARAAQRRQAR